MAPLTPCMLAQDGSFEEIRFCSGNGLRLYDVLFVWVLVADMVHRNSNATLEGANSDREREGERARERERVQYISLQSRGTSYSFTLPQSPVTNGGAMCPGGLNTPHALMKKGRERERERAKLPWCQESFRKQLEVAQAENDEQLQATRIPTEAHSPFWSHASKVPVVFATCTAVASTDAHAHTRSLSLSLSPSLSLSLHFFLSYFLFIVRSFPLALPLFVPLSLSLSLSGAWLLWSSTPASQS